ncbi:MAG: DUF4372 domain-containing protein [Deltaproteobacteria bacterium]|nr:MAG: DUF4372 domain-containing protein [Deltaproteobacteria bacterium]
MQAIGHSNTICHSRLAGLHLVDRHDFRKIETNRFQPRRRYQSLTRWSQFVVMMFAQITGRTLLRSILL